MAIHIGQFNTLEILKSTGPGFFLDGGEAGEILLPKRYAPEACDVGDRLEVFLYYDSEDRLIATTETPYAMVGEFAYLKVNAIERVGAFLDWGLPKDLLLPHREQTRELGEHQGVVVFVYLDKSNRISASMRLDKFVDTSPAPYYEGDRVELLVAARTDIGYKAIVDDRFWGVLYANEVFRPLEYGQRLEGFIRKVREDGKIDLGLQQAGHKASGDVSELILDQLREAKGFLPVHDKTPAEEIYDRFGVSKKKFKMAVGNLMKKGLVALEEDGIRLVP